MSPRFRYIASIALSLFVSSNSFAATWNVTPDGTGDAPTIQAAIDSAATGDEVVLADGTFSEDGNENIDFLGKAITVRSASGDPSACVVEIVRESDLVAVRGFLFQNSEGETSVLRGVTIRKAYLGASSSTRNGAGVYCVDASPTIENCVFVRAGADAEIRGCLFDGNSNYFWGGGISAYQASVRIFDSVFRNNVSWFGAGLYGEGASLQVTGCRFEGNIGSIGGGVCALYGTDLFLVESVLQGNRTSGEGAAILAGLVGSCIVDRCTIAGNYSGNRGGGLLIDQGTAQIANSILWGNCSDLDGLGPDDLRVYSSSSAAVLLCSDVDTLGVHGPGEVLYKSWNIFDDPLFCDPVDCAEAPTTEGDYSLHADSPCLHLPYCFPAGALGEGCGVVTSVQEGRWERSSWGEVKKMFR